MNERDQILSRLNLKPLQESDLQARKFEFSMGGDYSIVKSKDEMMKSARKCKAGGVYLWLLKLGNKRFPVYVGRTKCLDGRLANYTAQFQPASPNDRKIVFVFEWLSKNIPAGSVELWFCSGGGATMEGDVRNGRLGWSKPFLNDLSLKAYCPKLSAAYQSAYTLAIEAKLK